jgi:hypothetical protein
MRPVLDLKRRIRSIVSLRCSNMEHGHFQHGHFRIVYIAWVVQNKLCGTTLYIIDKFLVLYCVR